MNAFLQQTPLRQMPYTSLWGTTVLHFEKDKPDIQVTRDG